MFRIYSKIKAGLQSCCSASLGSGIALSSKQQHRSPRRYARAYTNKCKVYDRIHIHGHLMLLCFGTCEFTRFRLAKTKRLKRHFIMSEPHPEKDIIPPRRGIRVQNYKEKMKYANFLQKKDHHAGARWSKSGIIIARLPPIHRPFMLGQC